MCLIAIAYRASSRYPLIVAANRDERHARPTTAAHWWPGAEILGGRDEAAGGSWLALDRAGRFAAVTNRPAPAPADTAPSRGALVVDFLSSPLETDERGGTDFEQRLAAVAGRYAGFNLLLLDGRGLRLIGNSGRTHALDAGVHALSNDGRDCRWPKVLAAKRRLAAIAAGAALESSRPLESLEPLFALLADGGGDERANVDYREAAFIVGPEYGTRSSTVVLIDTERNVSLTERSFDASGRQIGETAHVFKAGQSPGA
jgi:uncharacterized protein with NRDE domain